MSSNDSNEVIYYTNVHYNSTINPIDSAYSTFLNSDLLSNQNNYLISLKLAIYRVFP